MQKDARPVVTGGRHHLEKGTAVGWALMIEYQKMHVMDLPRCLCPMVVQPSLIYLRFS
ncbi:hypothetical protein GCM10011415_05380 [Salipiger pallidus]|uniref:Uncharacterized protein n=1 Tax=Salipiger pallidus TaxID=1775170 RepID=A0A8J3EF79_9RHOB|nr:hypothetical protein GCM10011415_05380 [Salipiger pallidus]